jgi:methylmalonyl-CoA mutase C-terminal domain/subunit
VFGGVIPERDVEKMKEMGVKGIFGPGSSAESIVTFLRENVRQPRVDFD